MERTPFNWDQVEVEQEDLSRLVRLEGIYMDLVKRCQQKAFPEGFLRLKNGQVFHRTSTLLFCMPQIKEGIIRLGGRIELTDLPYGSRHPPIPPGSHLFTKKVLTAFHARLKHVGSEFLLTNVRQHFWIVRGREAVKRVNRDCQDCRCRTQRFRYFEP